jgi:superfamily II DNA or RNA helicase
VIRFRFFRGTLEITGVFDAEHIETLRAAVPELVFDGRTKQWRAPASAYAPLVLQLRKLAIAYTDDAKAYTAPAFSLHVHRELRPYQTEALARFEAYRSRGVVVLPTGSGKTEVAVRAIQRLGRSTLVVAPTLELVRQWATLLSAAFQQEIGIVGGGSHEIRDLTVTTYDSAHLHMDHLGNRFGFLVFDECHHLPGASYVYAARASIAPFRLGLTATPDRSDGREKMLFDVLGPLVFQQDITDLAGEFLAEYQTERVKVSLTSEEREAYEIARASYREFVVKNGIQMGTPQGFQSFMMRASRSEEGMLAFKAFREQRAIAFACKAKLDHLEHVIEEHVHGQHDKAVGGIIVFTQDNRTAHHISLRFLIPCITHHTRIKERIDILGKFRAGVLPAIVTSKVLNEGVDIPAASVAVIMSGSASVREHVQRLGRILRRTPGKQARLIELVTQSTTEEQVSERRRDHSAYR